MYRETEALYFPDDRPGLLFLRLKKRKKKRKDRPCRVLQLQVIVRPKLLSPRHKGQRPLQTAVIEANDF